MLRGLSAKDFATAFSFPLLEHAAPWPIAYGGEAAHSLTRPHCYMALALDSLGKFGMIRYRSFALLWPRRLVG